MKKTIYRCDLCGGSMDYDSKNGYRGTLSITLKGDGNNRTDKKIECCCYCSDKVEGFIAEMESSFKTEVIINVIRK